MRIASVLIVCILGLQLPSIAQSGRTFYSLEEALADPQNATGLNIRNVTEWPNEISQLPNLRELSISGLTYFPEELLELTKLEKLSLFYHEISTVPEGIDRLINLRVLNAQGKKQTVAWPASLANLSNLEELDLSQNGLNTLPDLSKLTKLRKLNLGYNEFDELPDVFAQLKALEELSLAGNGLSTLPPSIGQLEGLASLDLKYNHMTAVPQEVFSCRDLKSLELTKNGLQSLADEIGQLSELRVLDLGGNELTDLPVSFSDLEKLEELNIDGNLFTEIFPPALYGLSSLRKLSYHRFLLSYEEDYRQRPLGAGFCALTALEELNINATELTALPSCFGSLTNLQRLTITMSPKSHTFPNEIAQLANLESLKFVSRGYPIREIPPEIRQLTRLQRFELGKEQMSDQSKAQLQRLLPDCRIKYGR